MTLPRLDFDPRRDGRSRFPLEWVSELGCWCVYDGDTITTILKSKDFAAVDFAELHRVYEKKVGIDCSTLIRVLYHVATANEGNRHAEIRRDVARVLTAKPLSCTVESVTQRKPDWVFVYYCSIVVQFRA